MERFILSENVLPTSSSIRLFGHDYAGVTLRNKDLMPTTFHPMDPMDQKKSSSEHQRMLGIADVKPVAEQDTDKSDAPELVLVTQAELDFKQPDIIDRKAKFIDESKQMSTTVSSKILYKRRRHGAVAVGRELAPEVAGGAARHLHQVLDALPVAQPAQQVGRHKALQLPRRPCHGRAAEALAAQQAGVAEHSHRAAEPAEAHDGR